MKTTVIKSQGVIDNPTMLIEGVVINNTTGNPFWFDNKEGVFVIGRDPFLDGETFEEYANRHLVDVRVFNGEMYSTDNPAPFAPYKTETINGKIVRYYNLRLYSTVWDTEDGKKYGSRYLHGTGERIDILSDEYDISIDGSASTDYSSQLRFGEDYLKYGNFDDTVILGWHYGEANTSLFRNNQSLKRIALTGIKLHMTGTIMDFIACGSTVVHIDLFLQKDIKGVLSEYLNAIANDVEEGHSIYFFLEGSGVVNDVSDRYEFTVEFDGKGGWSVVEQN